jgi:hypothetical protein
MPFVLHLTHALLLHCFLSSFPLLLFEFQSRYLHLFFFRRSDPLPKGLYIVEDGCPRQTHINNFKYTCIERIFFLVFTVTYSN